ncbi:MAG TPA: nuclear transport factor 2 family protein [Caulobacteraceae bacterium]
MAYDPDDLRRLEARRCAAIAAGDLASLADVLAGDYLHVLAPGRVCDKAGYVEMIGRSPRSPKRGALRVRLYGDAAIVEGELENSIGAAGEVSRVIPAYCTQVAAYRDGAWRFVSYILTQKRPPRAA